MAGALLEVAAALGPALLAVAGPVAVVAAAVVQAVAGAGGGAAREVAAALAVAVPAAVVPATGPAGAGAPGAGGGVLAFAPAAPVPLDALPAALLAGAAGLAVHHGRRARTAGSARRRAAPGAAAIRGTGRPPGAGPAWLGPRLVAAGIERPPVEVARAWGGGAATVVVLGAWAGGPALAVLAAVASGAGPLLALVALRDRGDRRVEASVPEVLEGVARSLRSGASLRQALDEAARQAPPALAADLDAVGRAVAHGVPLVAALDAWAERRPLPAVRLAVAALALGAEAGGAPARAVDGVAATLRGRQAVQAEVTAMASQARASALVITLAPLAFAGLATATDERTASFLFRTPAGLACLAVGLSLDAVAAWWMRRLTRIDG